MRVKLNVKFTEREQVSEWSDHVHDVKIIKQYKNISGRYENDCGACLGMRTGHSNDRVCMDKIKNWLLWKRKWKGPEMATRGQGNNSSFPDLKGWEVWDQRSFIWQGSGEDMSSGESQAPDRERGEGSFQGCCRYRRLPRMDQVTPVFLNWVDVSPRDEDWAFWVSCGIWHKQGYRENESQLLCFLRVSS